MNQEYLLISKFCLIIEGGMMCISNVIYSQPLIYMYGPY